MTDPIRFRKKFDTTVADPAWYTSKVHPNGYTLTVGGTTTDGAYTINVVPEDASGTIANTFTRAAAETDGAIGTALDALLIADYATDGTLDPYIASTSDDAAGVITAVSESVRINAPHTPYRVTTAAPAPGTLVVLPDDVYPITRIVPPGKTGCIFTFRAVNSSGVELANNTTSFTAYVTTVSSGPIPYGARVDMFGRSASASVSLEENLVEPDLVGGMEVTVNLSALTSPPATIAALEVWGTWI